MKNLWKKEFHAQKTSDTAESILEGQCTFLLQQTNGKIIAKVSAYDGPKDNDFSETIKMPSFMKMPNVQKNLGEVEDSKFVFEFYITSRATPNYKYRVMFIEYGIAFYPVTITLDETIAEEIKETTKIECQTQEVFEEKLEMILGSAKLEQIINNLLLIVGQDALDF